MTEAAPTARATTMRPSASKLFRIRKTCLKMLSKRGYLVSDEELNGTSQDFVDKFGDESTRDQMMLFVEKTDDTSDQLMVFFPEDEKVGVKPIKSFCDQMQQQNVSRAIMVVKHSITPFAKQAIQEMAENYKIEYFRDSELLVDITEHRLVPEHIVLDDVSKKKLLKRYRLRQGQLPRIQKDDPVARYYGLEKGMVVKIIRNSEPAGALRDLSGLHMTYSSD
eukprot:FR742007.1.p1 GENE.FR742007.1~~FR742007.1.p1  ORF type:complete len:222 (+),score=33.51 FR742007.1:131-796(+)